MIRRLNLNIDHLTTNSGSYHLETSHRRFKHCYVITVLLKSMFLDVLCYFPATINYLNLRHRHNRSLTRPAVSSREGYPNSSERHKSSLLVRVHFLAAVFRSRNSLLAIMPVKSANHRLAFSLALANQQFCFTVNPGRCRSRVNSNSKNSINITNSCFPYLGVSCCFRRFGATFRKLKSDLEFARAFLKCSDQRSSIPLIANTIQADLSIRKQEDV